MITNSPSSLLSKARAFAAKTAVIAIAPLALTQVAHAASSIFLTADASSLGTSITDFFSSSGGSITPSGFSSTNLANFNGITGVTQSVTVAYQFDGSGTGTATLNLGSASVIGIPPGSNIATSYDFSLSGNVGLSVTDWTLDFGLTDASTPGFVTGVGTGSFSDTVNLVTGADTTDYAPTLVIHLSGVTFGETLTVTVNSLAYNVSTIPEPSSYAAFLGLGALGFVGLRRRRLNTIA